MVSAPGKFYQTGPAENSPYRQKLPHQSARKWFPPELNFSPRPSALLVNATRSVSGTQIA
jgi:hypothetical protein